MRKGIGRSFTLASKKGSVQSSGKPPNLPVFSETQLKELHDLKLDIEVVSSAILQKGAVIPIDYLGLVHR